MKKKFGIYALSFFMAVLMVFQPPLQVIAASVVEYISEIRIGYGAEGKKALEDAGYIVIDYDVNEGGKGNAVYLGYKKTNVKEDAITDMAIMPMRINGQSPFSFDLYEEEMEHISDQVDQMLENFDAAIKEFRTNLKKPSPQNEYAQLAYEMLNQYVEDDTGLGVGDLFAMERLNDEDVHGWELEEVYHKILMMGNSVAVSAIQTALALGCTETGGETFLDRLQKGSYTGDVDEEYNDSINILAQQFSSFREGLLVAKDVHTVAYSYKDGHEKYIETLDESDRTLAYKQLALVEIMSSIEYADLEMDGKQLSFLDVAILPTDVTAGQVCLNASMLEPLAKAMTPGQVAISQYVSLEMLISNAYSTTFAMTTDENGDEHYDLSLADSYLENLKQMDKLSVYTGVDRSVFDDQNYHTVAITTAAIKSNTLNESFGAEAGYKESDAYKKLGYAGVGVAAVGGITLIAACTQIGAIKTTISAVSKLGQQFSYVDSRGIELFSGTEDQFANYMDTWHYQNPEMDFPEVTQVVSTDASEPLSGLQTVEYTTSLGTKVAAVAGAITFAIGIALAIYGFISARNANAPQEVDYDPIPRAIIDVRTDSVTGDDKYFIYYAARLVDASDDYKNEQDTTKLYGDLNGLSHYEQWACLYYAKDMRIGSPITTSKILVQASSSLSTLQVSRGYVPIHSFFDNTLIVNNTEYTPMNMNEYSTNKDASKIYVFFKRDLKTPALTSTIMDETTTFNWLSVVMFFVGAGASAGVAVALSKSKKNRKKREISQDA